MTASIAIKPERITGYSQEQLASAFDRVRNPRDWQAPIHAIIPIWERPVVEKAVLWFTDTVPIFVPAPGAADRLMVSAAGYRRGPAGDTPGVGA